MPLAIFEESGARFRFEVVAVLPKPEGDEALLFAVIAVVAACVLGPTDCSTALASASAAFAVPDDFPLAEATLFCWSES